MLNFGRVAGKLLGLGQSTVVSQQKLEEQRQALGEALKTAIKLIPNYDKVASLSSNPNQTEADVEAKAKRNFKDKTQDFLAGIENVGANADKRQITNYLAALIFTSDIQAYSLSRSPYGNLNGNLQKLMKLGQEHNAFLVTRGVIQDVDRAHHHAYKTFLDQPARNMKQALAKAQKQAIAFVKAAQADYDGDQKDFGAFVAKNIIRALQDHAGLTYPPKIEFIEPIVMKEKQEARREADAIGRGHRVQRRGPIIDPSLDDLNDGLTQEGRIPPRRGLLAKPKLDTYVPSDPVETHKSNTCLNDIQTAIQDCVSNQPSAKVTDHVQARLARTPRLGKGIDTLPAAIQAIRNLSPSAQIRAYKNMSFNTTKKGQTEIDEAIGLPKRLADLSLDQVERATNGMKLINIAGAAMTLRRYAEGCPEKPDASFVDALSRVERTAKFAVKTLNEQECAHVIQGLAGSMTVGVAADQAQQANPNHPLPKSRTPSKHPVPGGRQPS